MLINKKSKGKNQPHKNTNSKNKITKPNQKQQRPKLPPKPHHHISTLSLLNNHNASQCSLISGDKRKLSASKILKSHHESSINLHNKSSGKGKKKGKKSMLKKSPKKTSPVHKKKPQRRDQAYQRIQVAQYNSKTHSQINFSHNTSERDHCNFIKGKKKNLRIDCSDDCILNQYFSNNAIRNCDKLRNESALKIQKVYRGYLTRKMLQNFITKQQARLYEMALKIKKSPSSIKEHSYFKQTPPKSGTYRNQQKQIYNSDFSEQQFDDELEISIRRQDSDKKIDHGPLLEQSSIYGGPDSLSKYIPEESHNFQYQQPKNNYEYITYSEQLQKMQKQPISSNRLTSYNKNQQPIPTDFSQKKISDFHSELDFRKNRQTQLSNDNSNWDEKNTKISERQITKQTAIKSKEKQFIGFLKKEQQKKWGKVIQMLNQHIAQSHHHNNDLEGFMNVILDFSRKNKQQLEKTYLLYSDKKKQGNSYQVIKIDQRQQIYGEVNNEDEKKQLIFENQSIDRQYSDNMVNILKEQSVQIEKIRKNQDMPLIRRKNHKDSPCNLNEKTENLKKYFRKGLTNYPVEEMIKIREKALEKRQKQMVNKLNEDLQKSSISHQDFLARLADMQDKFQQEKGLINQAKMQIFMGHQAVNKLVQDSFLDARYLGFKIPFSYSLKDIKSSNCLWIKQVIVDELKQFHKSNKKQSNRLELKLDQKQQNSHLSINLKHEQSHSIQLSNTIIEDQLSYNEGAIQNAHHKFQNLNSFSEQFNDDSEEDSQQMVEPPPRFKRINPTSSQLTILENAELFNNSRQQFQKQFLNKISINKRPDNKNHKFLQNIDKYEKTPRVNPVINLPKTQLYNVSFQSSSEQEQIIFDEDLDPTIYQITQSQIAKLIWEVSGQIFENSHMWRKFNRPKNKVPLKINQNQRVIFINQLFANIPEVDHLIQRLNQKMTPSKLELLKYMRVTLDEGSQFQESDQFQEVGKYQLVFSPEMCLKTIEAFLELGIQTNEDIIDENQITNILGDKVGEACLKKVIERQKLQIFSSNQRKDLRNQIKKIQMHCIFDALNQNVLKIRSKNVGYSGIGLNELSSLLIGNCQQQRAIKCEQQVTKILDKSKQELLEIVSENKTSSEKLLVQNYEQLCRNDSQWILYSDQALSFALELVFMVEDHFFIEELKEIQDIFSRKGKP